MVLSAAAYWLLFRPWSSAALGFVLAASVWATVDRSPWISNHWMLAFVVSLTILLAFVRALLRDRGFRRPELLRDLAPAVRLELLLFYLWSFFHKLNTDYLDAGVSCGSVLYQLLARKITFLPVTDWTMAVAIYGSLVVELAIPLLLVPQRSRWAGLLLAAIFHFILGIGGFFNFSAYIFALLFLFLPEDLPAVLGRGWGASSLRRRLLALGRPEVIARAYLWTTRGLLAIAIAILLSQTSWSGRERFRLLMLAREETRSIFSYVFEAIWWVGALLLAVVCWKAIRASRTGWGKAFRLLRPAHPVYALPLLLVFLNGLSPYLGLKTETSFAMFSNLRTEGRAWNHLILPGRLSLANYQDDLVAIESSADPELQRLADVRYEIPYFEFRSYLSRMARSEPDPIRVTYRRAGERRSIVDATREPELVRPDSWWLRKLLYFRPVPSGEKTLCHH
ncbi:MAG TPA: hypothetical protein VM737_08120 [Gemmatimonadota bacterium]|nr:hypothetical protein [Gemmatimonadota bacterium]